jgi:hypothetical protein
MQRTNIDELLAESRRNLERLDPQQSARALAEGATLIDIRSESQIARDGRIPGALVIARNVLEWRLDPSSDAAGARLHPCHGPRRRLSGVA